MTRFRRLRDACRAGAMAALCVLAAPVQAQEERTLTSGGFERSFLLVGAEPGRPRPLILALHGNRGTGEQLLRYSVLTPLAAGAGIVAALPDGLNTAWADGRSDAEFRGRKPPAGLDDVAFLADLVGALIREGVADPRRIYVMGLSNGGMMALRLLCDRPGLFAAGAVVMASLPESGAARCRPSRPVPLLLMNGTQDRLVPDQPQQGYLGTEGTAVFWRRINRCGPMGPAQELPDADPSDGSRVTLALGQCPSGQDIAVYRVVGGGHQMPSIVGPALASRLLGPRNRDIEGVEVIWAFFQRFSR
jgi:polyhydroxybutyrate depolymerase